MEQSGYDYEEEEFDIGGEEEIVPRNISTPFINSVMTSTQKMNPIMINSSQAD